MTKVRVWPVAQYGKMPELDDYITQNKGASTAHRFTVDGEDFCNLTLARKAAKRLIGLRSTKSLHTIVNYTVGRRAR